MKTTLKYILRIGLPLLLAGVILHWMYSGVDWGAVWAALEGGMNWWWMLLSMPFGISAQVFRALRWRVVLKPMGENPRLSTCCNSIFLSYASSLAIPRVGEVLRCGVLNRQDGVSFSRLVGTVMSERVVDMLMVLLISSFTFLVEIPVFVRFCKYTGVSLDGLLHTFTSAGYLVAGACLLVALVTGVFIIYKLNVFSRTRTVIRELQSGLLSVFRLKRPFWFFFHSVGIWVSYYLHFYLTFFCFDFTAHLGPMVALVAFVVGSFAVLVPTPNGAGPWHFAVKTVLVLFGVSAVNGAMFALLVHSIQTLLVALLGLYALAAIGLDKRRIVPDASTHTENP